jgi:hypothetical protein
VTGLDVFLQRKKAKIEAAEDAPENEEALSKVKFAKKSPLKDNKDDFKENAVCEDID